MADTFTTSLSIRQIETGTRSGTWGTETNTQYELFDNAFSYVANDLASDADATLTISDGTASNARYFYIKFTSSVSLTATRTITLAPDDSKKIWIVENATTGSQSLTFKQGSSGSTVTVSNGNTAMIYADGAGATNGAIENVLSNIQISDSIDLVGSTPTLTIGDGGEEDTKIVFDGNAQDFYIGLDDSADDLVIGVGSTVGTTPAIVIDENQNVGIGVTPGQNFNLEDTGAVEARFRSTDNDCFLQISSDTDEGQDSVLQFLSGTSARGSITYDHNTTATSQNMIFKTGDNAVSAMTINGEGRVGVNGVTSPAAELHVNGDSIANTFKLIANSTVSGSDATIFRPADNTMAFSTNGAERMRLLSSGGLTFNGDTAAANALDDYEEGTWTPTYVSNSGLSSVSGITGASGFYVKVGKLVHLQAAFTMNGSSGNTIVAGDNIRIAGEPFEAEGGWTSSPGVCYTSNAFTNLGISFGTAYHYSTYYVVQFGAVAGGVWAGDEANTVEIAQTLKIA